ncbi:surface-adhesin E family protein [Orbaceae bacterium ESL0721]|nr:surface-adhesin E family protein [Orbaceae bacterium ESL0721]
MEHCQLFTLFPTNLALLKKLVLKKLVLKKIVLKKIVLKITLTTLIFSSPAFATATKSDIESFAEERNESLKDPLVGQRYIPTNKFEIGNAITYKFIDRNSIKLHPYNSNIRLFNEVITYGPPQMLPTADGKEIAYRSSIFEHKANCDQMEIATGNIHYFEHYFGNGELINTDNFPRRWQTTVRGNNQHNQLTIVCGLPLAE